MKRNRVIEVTIHIGDYSYKSFGVSANFIVHLGNFLGLYVNIDATKRNEGDIKSSESEVFYTPDFGNTWRICPSIGVVIQVMEG